jgi:hypothetical protein
MHNIVSAADLHDVYSTVIFAAQQISSVKQLQQINAALLQFSNTGDALALHTALSNINTSSSALGDACAYLSNYVSVV